MTPEILKRGSGACMSENIVIILKLFELSETTDLSLWMKPIYDPDTVQ